MTLTTINLSKLGIEIPDEWRVEEAMVYDEEDVYSSQYQVVFEPTGVVEFTTSSIMEAITYIDRAAKELAYMRRIKYVPSKAAMAAIASMDLPQDVVRDEGTKDRREFIWVPAPSDDSGDGGAGGPVRH